MLSAAQPPWAWLRFLRLATAGFAVHEDHAHIVEVDITWMSAGLVGRAIGNLIIKHTCATASIGSLSSANPHATCRVTYTEECCSGNGELGATWLPHLATLGQDKMPAVMHARTLMSAAAAAGKPGAHGPASRVWTAAVPEPHSATSQPVCCTQLPATADEATGPVGSAAEPGSRARPLHPEPTSQILLHW